MERRNKVITWFINWPMSMNVWLLIQYNEYFLQFFMYIFLILFYTKTEA